VDNFYFPFVGLAGIVYISGVIHRCKNNDKKELQRLPLYETSRALYGRIRVVAYWLYVGHCIQMIFFRKIISLGRSVSIVIPKAICDDLGYRPYDDVAIFITNERDILIKKMAPIDVSNFVKEFEPTIDYKK